MGALGWSEILIVLLLIVVLFGAKRIPELARSLGEGIRLFKKGLKDVEKDLDISGDKKQ